MSEASFPIPNVPAEAWPADRRDASRRPRVWPGVLIIALQVVLIFVIPRLLPPTPALFLLVFMGPLVCGLLMIVSWLFLSRIRWLDRLFVLGAFFGGAVAAAVLADPSFQYGLVMYALPGVTSAWVLWLVATPFFSWPVRRAGLLLLIVLGWGSATMLRMDGVTGTFSPQISFRWSKTADEIFQEYLAKRGTQAVAPVADAAAVTLQPGDWPEFRGTKRDGILTGVRIGTDWSTPPRQVWRHPVGLGWSSFAVVSGRLYTQEQRVQAEAVVCYDAESGKELWAHEDESRFEENLGGAGPRATPTFHEGKIYALGGRGLLNCLDAATGKVIWERDARADAEAAVPQWGFSSSPLVTQGVVIVLTGKEGKCLSAYDAAKGGEPLWQSGDGNHSYSSPQPGRLFGVDQVLIATNTGLCGVDPKQGTVLWRYEWLTEGPAPRCVQPAIVGDSDVLLATGMGMGERRVRVNRKTDETVEASEVWTSHDLNAYFNDRVIHKGHIYGFDSNMFTCINLDDGKACWSGGRYGNGQVLLLADQDLLLVLSEKGDVALVAADPEKHRPLARFHALNGKCWNHPVVAHGKLFVRNGEEAACYELPGWKEDTARD